MSWESITSITEGTPFFIGPYLQDPRTCTMNFRKDS